jgi:hypothetical protein
MNHDREFLSRLFAFLDERSISYCVLRNWERLPDTVGNDVDVWIDGARKREFEQGVLAIARELDWRLVQRWFWLGYHGDGLFTFAQPERGGCLVLDAFEYLTWKGLRYLDETALPRLTQRHEKGFAILRPGAEAASNVARELLFEQGLRERYRASVARQAQADPGSFLAVTVPVMGDELARRLLELSSTERWDELAALRHPLRRELARRAFGRNPLRAAALCVRHYYFRARHRLRPPGGFFMVLLGPDGVGKTTTANALLQSLVVRRLFEPGSYLYRRFPLFPELKVFLPPALRRRVSLSMAEETAADLSEEGAPPISALRSMVYLSYYGLEYFLGRLWLWRRCTLGNRIVVFDRYWYEFLLQARYDRAPRWVVRLVERMAAQPDALIFLEIAPEVAYERKREKPLAEIRRIHRICGEVVARSPRGHTVPAVGVAPTVEHLNRIILGRMVERAAHDSATRSR